MANLSVEQIDDKFIAEALDDMDTRLQEFCSLTLKPKETIFQIAVTTLAAIGTALGNHVARTNELVSVRLGNFLTIGVSNRESENGDKEGNLSPYAVFDEDLLEIVEANQAPRNPQFRKTKDEILLSAIDIARKELDTNNGIDLGEKIRFVPYEVLLTFFESLILKISLKIKEDGAERVDTQVDNLFMLSGWKNEEGKIEFGLAFGLKVKTQVKGDQVTEQD